MTQQELARAMRVLAEAAKRAAQACETLRDTINQLAGTADG